MKRFSKFNALLKRYLPFESYFLRLGIGFVLILFGVYSFLALAEDVTTNEPVVKFDLTVVNAIHANTSPSLIEIMRLISIAGSEVPAVITVIIVVYCIWKRRWLDLLLVVSAIGGSQIINELLKSVFHRIRPTFTDPIASVVGFSFPSGHSMGAMVFFGLMWYFLMRNTKLLFGRIVLSIATVVTVILVGFSRIYLGAHYPSDVLAGYAAGIAWLALTVSSGQILTNWRKVYFWRHPEKHIPKNPETP